MTVASQNPSTGVPITVSPNDRNNQGNGTTQFLHSYNNNQVVTLGAPLTAGVNTFAAWSGCNSVTGNPATTCNVTMSGDKTVTVIYNPPRMPIIRVIRNIPPRVVRGASISAQVEMDAPAPTGGLTVGLSVAPTSAASVPPSVPVPQGATLSQVFLITTSPTVAASTLVTVTATYQGVSVSASFYVDPPLVINSFNATAASVRAGNPISVTLNASGGAAPLQWAPFRRLGTGSWIPDPSPPYASVVYQGNGTTWTWTPTAADVGTWTLAAWARGSDSSRWGAWGNGEVGTGGPGQAPSLTVTVTTPPQPLVINSFYASTASVSAGTPIAVTLNASGSVAPLQWAPFRRLNGTSNWIPDPSPPYSSVVYRGNGTTWTWTPTAADVGTWTIAAWARGSDSSRWGTWGNGEVGTSGPGQAANLTVTVTPPPPPPVSRLAWMAPGNTPGYTMWDPTPTDLVLAGTVTNVPAGTTVVVIYTPWSDGHWYSGTTTTNSGGAWFFVIPNAILTTNYSAQVSASGIVPASNQCWSGPNANRVTLCP